MPEALKLLRKYYYQPAAQALHSEAYLCNFVTVESICASEYSGALKAPVR